MVLKMKILSVECSAASCSVALSDNGVLIGEEFTNVKLTHSETLMPMVKNVLENTKTDIDTVDVFSVSNGPGSFTGVRIAVAAVKGMADGVGKPCCGISTLETIAYPFFNRNCVVCSLMDARCSQVYTALFENDKRLTPDSAMLISELADSLKSIDKPIVFAGDGAAVTYEKLSGRFDNIILADAQHRYQRASSVAFLTEKYINSGKLPVSANELLPVYLRLPQAERELKKKKELKK